MTSLIVEQLQDTAKSVANRQIIAMLRILQSAKPYNNWYISIRIIFAEAEDVI